MRIHPISDLHIEFGDYEHPIPDCDVITMAGDIGTKLHGLRWAMTIDRPVVMTSGNHEFYGEKLTLVDKLRDLSKGSNVHFLENESVVIDGVRFLGATMFTDYELYGNGPLAEYQAQQSMNDFKQIRTGPQTGYRKVTPRDYRIIHQLSRIWLQDELNKPFDGKTVVLTHHAPSEMSVEEQYRNDPNTPSYASRLENIMLYNEIALWQHGHIHSNSDYNIGNTRVICNPRGYDEVALNPNFNPNLIVEI